MIITKIKGGLGNQLFQYAFGKKLSILNTTELKLDIGASSEAFHKNTDRKFSLNHFNIKGEIAPSQAVNDLKYRYGIFSKLIRAFSFWVLKRFHIDYEPNELRIENNRYVDGFWQSEKYFMDIRDLILEDISLRVPLKNEAEYIKDQIRNSVCPVSLHVRRGDYVSNQRTHIVHGIVCTIDYYEKAIMYIVSKLPSPTFFVFSDEIEWVKNNLSIPGGEVIYVSKPGIEDYEELILMSLCKHNIIANSSFSWWGAWLNQNPDKIVIAPKKWVNKVPDPHPNIVPENWIRI